MIDYALYAARGHDAIIAGTPEHGKNGDNIDGVCTDASDAIANILHHVAVEFDRRRTREDLPVAHGPLHERVLRESFARHALDCAWLHFSAELRGDPNGEAREPADIINPTEVN